MSEHWKVLEVHSSDELEIVKADISVNVDEIAIVNNNYTETAS